MLQGFIDGVTACYLQPLRRLLGGHDSLKPAIGIAQEALLKARLGANTAQSGGAQSDSEFYAAEAFGLLRKR